MNILLLFKKSTYAYRDVSSPFYKYYVNKLKSINRYGVTFRFVALFKRLCLSLVHKRPITYTFQQKNYYIYDTYNQARSLKALFDYDVNSVMLSIKTDVAGEQGINEFVPCLIALILSPILFSVFLFEKVIGVKTYSQAMFDLELYSLGQYLFYRFQFLASKPNSIVVANDHNPTLRALCYAAQACNIKVVYIQHASVSNHFPPLDCFDLALLDGQQSLEAYKDKNNEMCELLIIGAIRNLTFARNINTRDENKVGIAINPDTDLDQVRNYISRFIAYSSDIVIRVHPGQTKELPRIKKMFHELNVKITSPQEESLETFLFSSGFILAGSSSIHIEAIKVGAVSVFLEVDRDVKDNYGYMSKGCCLHFDNFILTFQNEILIKKERARQLKVASYFDCAISYDEIQAHTAINRAIELINKRVRIYG